jgi:hypothetical protein
MALHTLRHLQCLSASPTAPDLLVSAVLLRNDKYKRIFYMKFCDLARATHIYIINYDEEVSIVPKQRKSFLIN